MENWYYKTADVINKTIQLVFDFGVHWRFLDLNQRNLKRGNVIQYNDNLVVGIYWH